MNHINFDDGSICPCIYKGYRHLVSRVYFSASDTIEIENWVVLRASET